MHINDRVGVNHTSLIRGKTTKNETVIRLDVDNDCFVSSKDPGLVIKKEHDGEWKWEPVSDFDKLQEFLKTATVKEKREQLGLWKDSKPFLGLLGTPDGIVQDKEVTTMGTRWDELKFQKEEVSYSPKYHQPERWDKHYSQIMDSDVNIEIQKGINGTTAVMNEPEVIMQTKTTKIDRFVYVEEPCSPDNFRGWIPEGSSTYVEKGNKFELVKSGQTDGSSQKTEIPENKNTNGHNLPLEPHEYPKDFGLPLEPHEYPKDFGLPLEPSDPNYGRY